MPLPRVPPHSLKGGLCILYQADLDLSTLKRNVTPDTTFKVPEFPS